MKKSTAFVLGFAVVLLAGTASAWLGEMRPDATTPGELDPPERIVSAEETTTTTTVESGTTSAPAPVVGETTKTTVGRDEETTKPQPTAETKKDVAESPPPADDTPPELVVLHPGQGATVPVEAVFEGETEPGSRVFVGAREAEVGEAGAWRGVIVLEPGIRNVRVKAVDAAGNLSSVMVEVNVEGAKDRSEEPRKDVGFTVHQKYGEHNEPFEKLWGTAPPGTAVIATSPYGSADTTADDSGAWRLPMHFDVPSDTPFEITVRNGERTETLRFVWHVKEIGFTADQKYGSCGEEIPYDVFWGTAAPGSTVEATSPWGSAATSVGETGKWDLRVEFPDAPIGETFEVVLSDGNGGVLGFTFVRTSDASK